MQNIIARLWMRVSAQFGDTIISQKSAKALFRAMAIKDEYEVARLMLSPTLSKH